MKDITKDIVAKIKEEHIVPESKWYFLSRNYFFWLLLILMIALGITSALLVGLNMMDIDGGLVRHVGWQRMPFIVMRTAPYVWLALLVVALGVGVLAFHKTLHGYRYRLIVVGMSIGVSVVLFGLLAHTLRMERTLNRFLMKHEPMGMRGMLHPRDDRWSPQTDKSLFGGEVLRIVPQGFVMRDRKSKEWLVTGAHLKDDDQHIEIGERVGIVGERINEFSIRAFSIRELAE